MTSGPNCFLIGASKSGTTFAAGALGGCAEVFVPIKKEFHYFADDLDCGGLRVDSFEQYLSYFGDGEQYRWRLDASPSYLYSETAARGIAGFAPHAKIFILLRDPVVRAYSMYLHNRLRGYETVPFTDALAAEEERIAAGWPWGFHYLRSGLYADQVARYWDTFAAEDISLSVTEDLFADPSAVLREMLDRLGIRGDCSETVTAGRNQTGTARWALLSRLVSPRSERLRRLAHGMPDWVLRARRRLIGWNVKDAPPLDPAVAAELWGRFREDVQRLEELTGRRFPWGPESTAPKRLSE